MPLRIALASPDAAPWLPQPSALALIDRHTARDVDVRLWPRAMLAQAWGSTHQGAPPPELPPYAFRAWANPQLGRVTVLVDRTETPQSVTWLLLHELGHMELRTSPLVAGALAATVRDPAYMHDDHAHQADPEERIADWMATRWYRRLGFARPWRLDRHWWRARVRRMEPQR